MTSVSLLAACYNRWHRLVILDASYYTWFELVIQDSKYKRWSYLSYIIAIIDDVS